MASVQSHENLSSRHALAPGFRFRHVATNSETVMVAHRLSNPHLSERPLPGLRRPHRRRAAITPRNTARSAIQDCLIGDLTPVHAELIQSVLWDDSRAMAPARRTSIVRSTASEFGMDSRS